MSCNPTEPARGATDGVLKETVTPIFMVIEWEVLQAHLWIGLKIALDQVGSASHDIGWSVDEWWSKQQQHSHLKAVKQISGDFITLHQSMFYRISKECNLKVD